MKKVNLKIILVVLIMGLSCFLYLLIPNEKQSSLMDGVKMILLNYTMVTVLFAFWGFVLKNYIPKLYKYIKYFYIFYVLIMVGMQSVIFHFLDGISIKKLLPVQIIVLIINILCLIVFWKEEKKYEL